MKLAFAGAAGTRVTGWVEGRGPLLASVPLALGVAFLAARIVLGFLAAQPGHDQAQIANVALPAITGAAPGGIDAGAIANAHLFGVAGATGGADAAGAAQSASNLVLAGTIAYRDPGLGFAILGESAEAAKFYRIGAAVPGGALLRAVYADRVELETNGSVQTLALPRQALAGIGMSAAPLPTAAAPVSMPSFPNRPAGLPTVNRAMADDPAFVAEIIRPTPVLMDGQLQGFRVYPGRDRAAFGSLGLQPGDMITQVNGSPLTDPARGLSAITGLQPGDRVNVTVSRNGVTRDVTIEANQLAKAANSAAPPPEPTE
jgi:general secretion pathway protein C